MRESGQRNNTSLQLVHHSVLFVLVMGSFTKNGCTLRDLSRNNGREPRTQPRRLSWFGKAWNIVAMEWGRYQVITVLSVCLAIGDGNTQDFGHTYLVAPSYKRG